MSEIYIHSFLTKMPENFTSKTTAQEVVDEFADSVKGKHIIVTGGNSGLGLETVRVLAGKGGIMTLVARSKAKGEKALEGILAEFPDAQVTLMMMDLGSLQSIRDFIKSYLDLNKPLNILINNGGLISQELTHTQEGFETMFGVNHIGHFLLTQSLLPLLKKSGSKESPSKIVFVGSAAAYLSAPKHGIEFDDLDGKKRFNATERYGSSKLANTTYAWELNNRFQKESANVIAVSLHPGAINTSLVADASPFQIIKFMFQIKWRGLPLLALKSIPQGAACTVYCALSPEVNPGGFYWNCAPMPEKFNHGMFYDQEFAEKLWKISEEMTGITT